MVQLKCKHCGRHIGEAETIVGELLCPLSSCKGTTQFKILNNDVVKMIAYKFINQEREPKKKEARDGQNNNS